MLMFLLAQENWPFTFAIAFVLALGVFELLAVLLGLSLLNTIDDILPAKTDVDFRQHTAGYILNWLCLGKLPLLIWLALALTSFAILGYAINHLSLLWIYHFQPLWRVVSYSALLTIFSIHFTGNWLARLLPQHTTDTVDRDDLAGSVGRITIGTATCDSPAKALVKDAFLQRHYVTVIPDSPKETLTQGTSIILLCRKDGLWLAARYQHKRSR